MIAGEKEKGEPPPDGPDFWNLSGGKWGSSERGYK